MREENHAIFFEAVLAPFYRRKERKINQCKQDSMEKNQHNHKAGKEQQTDSSFPQHQPGQQLPSGAGTDAANHTDNPEKEERHSESSLPQSDNETLGTP